MKLFFGWRNQNRLVFATYVISILFLTYAVDREDFLQVGLAFALAFAVYFHWIERSYHRNLKHILVDATLIRILLIVAIPQLSDDYFRFIWDGHLLLSGENPYLTLPSEILIDSSYLSEIYEGMNSKEYYSVYPPVMQTIFWLAAAVGGENTLMQIAVMRVVLILSDLGIIYLGSKILVQLGRKAKDISLFAFNPLVIVELTGNLHFEGLMLFFTLLGIYILMNLNGIKRGLGSGTALALGVATKMTNALFLPALVRKVSFIQLLLIGMSLLVLILVAFIPFFDIDSISGIASSLDLYFRNFQFNSSLFAIGMHVLSDWIPHYTASYVGPFLSAFAVLMILILAFRKRMDSWQAYFASTLAIYTVYLLCSSTVHPWYIVNLILLATFTSYRFPIVWSFTVVLSYFMYSNDLYEVPWMIGLEYLLVLAYFIYERRKLTQLSKG